MAYLKYYRDERARHPEMDSVKWNLQQMRDAVEAMCAEFGLPSLPVSMSTKKKLQSWYSTNTKAIWFHPQMLNPRTCAHEFAHYWDHMDRIKYKVPMSAKWHGTRHLVRVEKAFAFIKKLPYYVTAATETSVLNGDAIVVYRFVVTDPTPSVGPVDLVQATFDALPNWLMCPKCLREKVKALFGVRVVKRDAAGTPTKVIRQSYCRHCR